MIPLANPPGDIARSSCAVESRSVIRVRILTCVLACELLGLAAITLQRGSVLSRSMPWSDPVLAAIAIGITAALLGGRSRRFGAMFAAGVLFGLPMLTALLENSLAARLAPVSSGARYLAPVALALWLTDLTTRRLGLKLLEVGVAATFFGHGLKAVLGSQKYVELIQSSASQWLGWTPSAEFCTHALRVIGVVDIAAALLLLCIGLRAALVYMMVWGAITAASRVTADGWHRIPDVVFRAPHFVVPWLLLVEARAESLFGQKLRRRD